MSSVRPTNTSLRSRGLPANIMAFSVRGTVASVSCSSGVPLLQGSTRLRVASASSAVMPATPPAEGASRTERHDQHHR
ncbi:hypothetical protein RA876_14270 [Rhodoferax antarcticus]|nr:hypothetical protein RA876_14270 [Rhodoferax antarcticus]